MCLLLHLIALCLRPDFLRSFCMAVFPGLDVSFKPKKAKEPTLKRVEGVMFKPL